MTKQIYNASSKLSPQTVGGAFAVALFGVIAWLFPVPQPPVGLEGAATVLFGAAFTVGYRFLPDNIRQKLTAGNVN